MYEYFQTMTKMCHKSKYKNNIAMKHYTKFNQLQILRKYYLLWVSYITSQLFLENFVKNLHIFDGKDTQLGGFGCLRSIKIDFQ